MPRPTGPAPAPTKLKILTGNPGKRRLPDHEPEPRVVILPPPSHLDEEAAAEWERMIQKLARLGLFTEIDVAALAVYCVAWSRHVAAEAAIKQYGLIIMSPNGYALPSPYLPIANKAMDQMLKILAEFGMSPSSRTRVKAAEIDQGGEDKWAGVL